jgi:2-dehydropantoate 2-reductase
MKVAILGPGAVGGVLAAGLVNAGVRVVCIARPDTAAVIRADGLVLRRGEDVVTARPDVSETLDEPIDLTFVTVKAPSLDEALERIQAPAGTVLPLLNGIEHMQTIRDRLRDANVVGASIGRIEAFLERPGVVIQPTPSVVMTVADDVDGATVELVRASGTDVRVNGSESAVLWEKLARQAPTAAATSITQRPIGELRSDSVWGPLLQQAIAEACSVAEAEGVTLSPEAEWEIIEAMPPLLTSSTARDIAAGRPSELDAITGAAVRAGRRAGVPIPALEQMLAEAEDVCRALSH